MIVNPAALESLFYQLRLLFDGAYDITDIWSSKIATEVPSSSREQIYPFLARVPRMKEWVGERLLNNLVGNAYRLLNKDWEDTIEVDRNDIEDEQLALYSMGIQQLGVAAKKWPDDVMLDVLQGGVTALGFDGVPFFSASHPKSDGTGGVYSNLITGNALSASNFQATRAAMLAYTGENGKNLNVKPNLLVVPPQLEATARQILNAEFIAPAAAFGQNAVGGFQSNVLRGSAELLVVNELSNQATAWYLLDVSKPVKPFIWQVRKAPVLTSLTSPTDPNVFNTKKFLYGVDSRGNGGYALPFLATRNTP